MVRKQGEACRWDGVEVYPYKENGTHFKAITRQTLFAGEGDLPVELRYFEIGPNGHSTCERHVHTHLVMVVKGGGSAMVGDTVTEIGDKDIVRVPEHTWHQFRAGDDGLGFLCIVAVDRDRPTRPESLDQLPESVRDHARL